MRTEKPRFGCLLCAALLGSERGRCLQFLLTVLLSVGYAHGEELPNGSVVGDNQEKLSFIASANESALESIRTVAAHYIRYAQVKDSNGVRDVLGRFTHVWWWKDGTRHRLRYYTDPKASSHNKNPGGVYEKLNWMDVMMDDGRTSFLTGYDWLDRPQYSSRELKEFGISGLIGPRGAAFPQIDPMFDNCLHIQSQPSSRSLKQLVDTKGSAPRLIKKANDINHLWEIELTIPEDGRQLQVQIDPKANYLVTRVARGPSTDEKTTGGEVWTWEVQEFESSDGALFPKKVVVTTPSGVPGETYLVTLEYISLKINEALPNEAFDFSFPVGVAVADNFEGVTHVWGEDGPSQTIHNIEEDEQLKRKQLGKSESLTSRTANTFLWANIILVLVLMLFIIRKRWVMYSQRV